MVSTAPIGPVARVQAAPMPPPAAPVAPAATGASMSVLQAQEKLNAMGFEVGHPDGVLGAKTREQLMLFQKSRGIAETGELDAATLAEFNR
jgi:peptidoglycan hydrolase-like protein with peptidoglycan-binding domain